MVHQSRNKVIFSWALFDFANSPFATLIITFVYSTFFVKVIAGDEISGTSMWSKAVAFSAIVVALISPVLGSIADGGNHRKKFLMISSIIFCISTAMLYTILPGNPISALIWFIIANIFFEMGMVFYNAFLPEIAPPEKIGRISGFGWGLGYIGGLAALLVALLGFIKPDVPWFGFSKELGENIRAINLLTALWFFIFSLPMFIYVKENKFITKSKLSLKQSVLNLIQTFKEIKKYKQVIKFLIARIFYNDALVTIFAFGGIYAAGTFNFSFNEIMIFGIVINIAAGAGAFLMGYFDDYFGGKLTIQMSIIALLAASILAIFSQNKTFFWISGIIMGIFSGPNQSASRSFMARIIPSNKYNEFFGFFAFSGKLTAFLGPFLLGVITDTFESQRIGMLVVVVFFIIGFSILSTVKSD